jgi:lipoprotein-releasing system permease protein
LRLEWFIGLRYLRAKSQQRFVSFISLMSIAGVALGVGVLIATMAILTGFSGALQTKIAGTNAHVLVTRMGPFREWRPVMEQIKAVPDVTGAAPLIEGQVMVSSDFGSN